MLQALTPSCTNLADWAAESLRFRLEDHLSRLLELGAPAYHSRSVRGVMCKRTPSCLRTQGRLNDRPSCESLETRVLMSGDGLQAVLLDSALADADALRASVNPSAVVISYDSRTDSLETVIQRTVQASTDQGERFDSVTILSHGREGEFSLGDEWLNYETLAEHAEQWGQLNDVLVDGGGLYLFSCFTGAGAEGAALVDALADWTNATVHASDDLTGAGGDWTLEVVSTREGANQNGVPIRWEKLAGYEHTLAAPTLMLPGAINTFSENGVAVYLDNTATVTDAEGNWDGGTLSVQITSGAQAEDELSHHYENLPDSFHRTNSDYYYNDVKFATSNEISGTGSTEWIATFNADATTEAIQEFIRHISFFSLSENPGLSRTVTMTLTNGAGESTTQTKNVAVTSGNDAPSMNDSLLGSLDTSGLSENVTYQDAGIDHPALTQIRFSPGAGLSSEFRRIGSIETWGANATTLAEAVTNNEYINIHVDIAAGETIDFSTLNLPLYSRHGTAAFVLRSSLTGATDLETWSSVLKGNPATVDLGDLTEFQNVTGSFDFQLYVYADGAVDPITQHSMFGINTTTDEMDFELIGRVHEEQKTSMTNTVTFSTANGNALTITDADAADTDIIEATYTAGNGTVTFADLTGLTVTAGANGTSTITVQGTLADINAALEGLLYTRTAGVYTADTLSIVLDDLGNTGDDGAKTRSFVVDIAPASLVITDAAPTYIENGELVQIAPTLSVHGDDFDGATLTLQITGNAEADDVARYHTSIDGNVKVWPKRFKYQGVDLLSSGPGTMNAYGSASVTYTFNADATAEGIQAVLRTLVFVNDTEDFGTLDRTITLTLVEADGHTSVATQTVQLESRNDAPTVNEQALTDWDSQITSSGDDYFDVSPAHAALQNVRIDNGPGLDNTNDLINRVVFGTFDQTSLAAAVAAEEYISFAVDVTDGYALDLSRLVMDLAIRDTSDGTFVLRSTLTGDTDLASWSGKMWDEVDAELDGFAGLQDIQQDFEFRLYYYNHTVDASGWVGLDQGNTFDLYGGVRRTDSETDRDTNYTFCSADGNALTISDADAATDDIVEATMNVNNGVITLSQTTGLTITAGADGSNAVTVQGTIAEINAALEGMLYSPTYEYYGTDTLTLTVSDLGNTGDDAVVGTHTFEYALDVLAYDISGGVWEDIDGDGAISDDGVGVAGATARLYLDDGDGVISAGDTLKDTVATDGSGAYTFTGLGNYTYWVVLDSTTVSSTAGLNGGFDQGDLWAEQTYSGIGGVSYDGATYSYTTSAGSLLGGMQVGVSDDAGSLLTAEHVIRRTITSADQSNADAGFSFSAITHTGDADDDGAADRTSQGTLRQFLLNSNALNGVQAADFQLSTNDANYNSAGAKEWTFSPTSALPTITDRVTIDGSTQTGYAGRPVIVLNGNAAGAANGMTIQADNSRISNLTLQNFSGSGLYFDSVAGGTVTGCYLGLGAAGTTAAANGVGLSIVASSGVTIGGTTSAAKNIISGNTAQGVLIDSSSSVNVYGNTIGLNAAGSAALANGDDGILVQNGSSSIRVGGTSTGMGNRIAYNTGHGVSVTGATTNGVSIQCNSIYRNGLLGINLGADGVLSNDNLDVDTGANALQNYPVLLRIQTNELGTVITTVTLNSTANTTFRIELFVAALDSYGYGEGQTLHSSFTMTTNGSGNAEYQHRSDGVWLDAGQYYTATATNLGTMNTSEFCLSHSSEILTYNESLDEYEDTYSDPSTTESKSSESTSETESTQESATDNSSPQEESTASSESSPATESATEPTSENSSTPASSTTTESTEAESTSQNDTETSTETDTETNAESESPAPDPGKQSFEEQTGETSEDASDQSDSGRTPYKENNDDGNSSPPSSDFNEEDFIADTHRPEIEDTTTLAKLDAPQMDNLDRLLRAVRTRQKKIDQKRAEQIAQTGQEEQPVPVEELQPGEKNVTTLSEAEELPYEVAHVESPVWTVLDNIEQTIEHEEIEEQVVTKKRVGTAVGVSTALSVGYLAWSIKSGSLMASWVATLPTWQMLDPLPILDAQPTAPANNGGKGGNRDADDEEQGISRLFG